MHPFECNPHRARAAPPPALFTSLFIALSQLWAAF
jgi:hypothetical protein